MTASLQPETKSSSRRALLAGALGGIGAWAASAIGRTSPVRAANGQAVTVGGSFSETTVTSFSNTAGGNGVGGSSTTSGYGVYGGSVSGIGVIGVGTSGIGTYGVSTSNIGAFAYTNATDKPAVAGQSFGNSTGVQGYSGSLALPTTPAKTGVYGYAAQDSASVGVRGESPAGFGVYGKTTGTGFAGYFNGKVYMTQFLEMGEIAAPATPAANKARLFIKDNGLGKTQLVVKFANGSVKVLATES